MTTIILSAAKELLVTFTTVDAALRAAVAATFVLGVAGLAAAIAHRRSASTRHAIWLVGITTALAVAVLSAAGPEIKVETTVVNAPGVVSFDESFVSSMREIAAPVDRQERATDVPAPARVGPTLAQIVAGLWLLGVLVVIGRASIGHIGVARLIRRARPIGMAGNVEVRISAEVDAPFTLGARRPVVLLPAEAVQWDDERMRIVLVHELAHVARFDYVAQLVATAACALYWFNPIVWLAASRLRAEAEHAADDRVLAAGFDGVTYATHLLELARPESDARLSTAVAVGMARSTSRLERRFSAMLDSQRSRGIVPLRFQAAAGAAAMLAAVPLTGLRVIPVEKLVAPSVVTTSVGSPALVTAAPVTTAPVTTAPVTTAPVLAASVTAQRAASDTIIERTLAASAGERISLDLPTGGSVTVRAWDQPQVRLRALLSGDQARETRLSFDRVSGGLEVRATLDNPRNATRNSNRVELWVPRRFDVHISSAGGGIVIDGVDGRFTGQTGGGEILLDNLSGYTSLTTGGGEVRVTNSQLEGRVTTGGGEALVSNTSGNVQVTSGSGPVITTNSGARIYGVGGNDIAVTTRGQVGAAQAVTSTVTSGSAATRTSVASSAGTAIGGTRATTVGAGQSATISTATTTVPLIVVDGQVLTSAGYSMTKAGGNIELESVPNGGTFNTGGGDIFIGSAGGPIAVSTGGGDIEIGRASGDVAASTGAGTVRLTIVNDNGNVRHVNVSTGTGRVFIDLPANVDARFDIETAYTERHGRTNIDSEFPLNLTESESWDSRQGTPRRYVRGTASFGSGRGLIRIRTVNGDVVIRRR